MRPAYLCNACLAMHERSAGVTLRPIQAAPLARCDCGATAENVVDLDGGEPNEPAA